MRYVLLAALVLSIPLQAGQAPRSESVEETVSAAKELFSNGDYDKAVRLLERATRDIPAELRLKNLLAMAYLYSSSRVDAAANFGKVQPLMESVIDGGGEAILLVGKAVDKPKVKFVVKAVTGELRIRTNSVQFVPARGPAEEAVGPLTMPEIKECGPNKGYGADSNTFRVKTPRSELDFRPLHFSKDEAALACALLSKYLGAKITK